MNNQLMVINEKDSGLAPIVSSEIAQQFIEPIAKMEALETEFIKLQNKPMEKGLEKEAHALRMKFVGTRSSTAKIHKEGKNKYKLIGKFYDAIKNQQIKISESRETALLVKELHFKKIEEAKIKVIHDKRVQELKLCNVEDSIIIEAILGMEESVWKPYIEEQQAKFEAQKEAEKVAKEAKEKADYEARQAKHEAEQVEIANKAKRLKLEEENKAIQAENNRKAKEQADELARLKAEKEAKNKEQSSIIAQLKSDLEAAQKDNEPEPEPEPVKEEVAKPLDEVTRQVDELEKPGLNLIIVPLRDLGTDMKIEEVNGLLKTKKLNRIEMVNTEKSGENEQEIYFHFE